MDALGIGVDVALGMDQLVEMPTGGHEVHQLDTGQFNHPVARLGA